MHGDVYWPGSLIEIRPMRDSVSENSVDGSRGKTTEVDPWEGREEKRRGEEKRRKESLSSTVSFERI